MRNESAEEGRFQNKGSLPSSFLDSEIYMGKFWPEVESKTVEAINIKSIHCYHNPDWPGMSRQVTHDRKLAVDEGASWN